MNPMQTAKIQVPLVAATTNATNATASSAWTVDRSGYITVTVISPKATATDSAFKFTSFVIQEADGTSYAAIDGLTGTTNATASSTQFVLPAQNDTSNFAVMRFCINCATRKPNMRAVHESPGTNYQRHTIIVEKTRREEMAATTTSTDTDVLVIV